MATTKDHKSSRDFFPRLLMQNFHGRQSAVPLNDDLRMVAGVETWPIKMVGLLGAQEALSQDKGNTTIFVPGGGGGPFVVTLGIKQIFRRVAEARKKGELVIDLVTESGYAALRKRAKETTKNPPVTGSKDAISQFEADSFPSKRLWGQPRRGPHGNPY